MTDFGFWSLVPPVLAIALAIRTKQVVFSLVLGILVGYIIIHNGGVLDGLYATIDAFVNVFKSEGNTRTILFTLLIGALIQLIKYSGGINGFVAAVQKRLEGKPNFHKKVQVSAGLAGFLIFVESNISILTVGTIFRPLFDKLGLAREKLAYLADSSSAPSCILFPLNAWGAYIMGLLAAYETLDPFKTLVFSIPFNFYAISTLVFLFWMAATGKDFGEMKQAMAVSTKKSNEITQAASNERTTSAFNMLIPIAAMIISMPIYLINSGWGAAGEASNLLDKVWVSIGEGSGSQSVLFACVTALLVAAVLYAVQRLVNVKSYIEQSFKGMQEMLEMATLMMLAFAIGSLCKELGTGYYVASITETWLLPEIAPALIFIISSFIAFSTGTSWGTFAIMISIAVPLTASIDANPYLMIAAVLGGGVFGDHCSPISDTTLIASVASGCDHMSHVRTQLQYALITGAISILLYLVAGWLF